MDCSNCIPWTAKHRPTLARATLSWTENVLGDRASVNRGNAAINGSRATLNRDSATSNGGRVGGDGVSAGTGGEAVHGLRRAHHLLLHLPVQ
eukprot:758004-Rhodomonas_salina.1